MRTDCLIVNASRGEGIESRHRVHAMVSDKDGRLIACHGDETLAVFPRSAIKPLQALPLVESGGADTFGLTAHQISLACASHNGEAEHCDAVLAWLDHIGAHERDLVCAGHWSLDQSTLLHQARAQTKTKTKTQAQTQTPLSQRHNNCSGKHCAMLTLADHLAVPRQGYYRADHPVQQRILGVLEAMTASRLQMAEAGIDGCGIPTIPVPLGHLALAYAQWADPVEQPQHRKQAIARITNAIWDHPTAMAGTGRLCTLLNGLKRADDLDLLVKTGAEGVYCAALPTLGLGIALKVEDGATRASQVALMHILNRLGVFDLVSAQTRARLDALAQPPITSWDGVAVGRLFVQNDVQ